MCDMRFEMSDNHYSLTSLPSLPSCNSRLTSVYLRVTSFFNPETQRAQGIITSQYHLVKQPINQRCHPVLDTGSPEGF